MPSYGPPPRKGDKGDKGDPGTPGSNGAAGAPGGSDESFAAWVSANGSATRTALLELAAKAAAPSGADDGPMLTAALAASKDVLLGVGTYKVPPGFTVPAGTRLRGMGPNTILTYTTASSTTLLNLAADTELADLTLDAGTLQYHLSTGHRSKVNGCVFKNGSGYGIHVTAQEDVRIVGNYFLNIPSYAVLAEDAAVRFTFDGNHVVNLTGGQGLTVKVNPGNPTDVRIVGNTVDVAGVIGLEIQGAGATRGVINDNVVRHSEIGISLSSSNGVTVSGNTVADNITYGIEAAQVTTDSTIIGNTILRPGTGVIVSSPSASPASKGCVVEGNNIKDATLYGIAIEFGSSHVVSGNLIHNSGGRSIFLNNAPVGCIIKGNLITRTAVATNYDGIYYTGSGHLISGNNIDYSGLAAAQGYGIFSNGATVSVVSGNYIDKAKKAIAFAGGTRHHCIGNVTQNHTEHSVFTTGPVSVLHVDAHTSVQNGGAGVDTSGVTNAFVGSIYYGNLGTLTSGLTGLTKPLLLTGQTVGTAAPAAGAAGALPATPAGYLTVNVNGTARQVAYY